MQLLRRQIFVLVLTQSFDVLEDVFNGRASELQLLLQRYEELVSLCHLFDLIIDVYREGIRVYFEGP